MNKILIFTDSRGQHKPAGSSHLIFGERLKYELKDSDVDMILCPMKWTTTLDFIEFTKNYDISQYDWVILYTGIVEWSPRPFDSAMNDLYDNHNIANMKGWFDDSSNYSEKIVNNKKKIFDLLFGEQNIKSYLTHPFEIIYEDKPTINMYSLEMAENIVGPLLASFKNLIYINANKIVDGWEGDYKRGRPKNISIITQYSNVISKFFPQERLVDIGSWNDFEVKKYTCDNMHLTKAGSDWIFEKLIDIMEISTMNDWEKKKKYFLSMVTHNIEELINFKPIEKLSLERKNSFLKEYTEQKYFATLIIGVMLKEDDAYRLENLDFLLKWLNYYYKDLFDILIVEQGNSCKLEKKHYSSYSNIRYEFLFNNREFNRGWGYNVAVKHFCPDSKVVALMDTDILTGYNFLAMVRDCFVGKYKVISPYQNIYYSTADEVETIRSTLSLESLKDVACIKNPVTLTGGIAIFDKQTYMDLYGFEQYIGYGCEDRAFDTMLFDMIGNQYIHIAKTAYVHLYHPSDADARVNFKAIYEHLVNNYGCEWNSKLNKTDFIHLNCHHVCHDEVVELYEKKKESFADINLYQNAKISINGRGISDKTNNKEGSMEESKIIKSYLQQINIAIKEQDFDTAKQILLSAFEFHKKNEFYTNLFNMKQDEINILQISKHQLNSNLIKNHEILVILGNGPSLKYVMGNPVYRNILKKYHTFGLNAAYRAYDELDFWPTYHGCLDMIVVESHLENYRKILPKFKKMFLLAEDHLGNDIIGFEHLHLQKIFFDSLCKDSNEKVISTQFDKFRNWQNSGCNCVQIALMLGYKKVVLLGMDANYKEVLTEAEIVKDDKYKWDHLEIKKSVEANDNYWFSGYQQVGDKYNIPNAAKYHLPAWNALGLSEHGAKIINCSTETKISTIRRQSFEETFDVQPVYSALESMVKLKACNADYWRLENKIIQYENKLYVLAQEEGTLVRKFIAEAVWDNFISSGGKTDIYEVDKNCLKMPCNGIVDMLETNNKLRPGLTFLIRARNEYANVYMVLGSLKHILSNEKLNCEVVFVDNRSDDGTYEEVMRVCREQEIGNVFLAQYNIDVCPSGEAHSKLKAEKQIHRSLDTYYNWCLDRVQTYNVMKWDCDFLAIQKNLLDLIYRYDLPHSAEPLAIWCTGKTLFKKDDEFFVNTKTMYNEFRIFSKEMGYRWEYAPRWEICSQSYMVNAKKRVFSACVFLELKDLSKNEFAFRSQGGAILSDTRDTRDNTIMNSLREDMMNYKKLELDKLDFNPLLPTYFHNDELVHYEANLEELDAMQSYWLNVYSRPDVPIRFNHKGNVIIQGLWVGEHISELHKMCIESFIRHGHCFVLYTYNEVENVPDEAVIMDATKLIPPSMIYQHDGSYAGFSDLFRNKLLQSKGGWYVDLDIFCLRSFDVEQPIVFSMDHYHDDTIKVKKGTKEIIDDKYYVATNPCKITAGHEIVHQMYSLIFKKLVFEHIRTFFFAVNLETINPLEEKIDTLKLYSHIVHLGVLDDFEIFVVKVSELAKSVSFIDLLKVAGMSANEVGQKTWGEVGPIMVTKEVVTRGLVQYTTKPEMFQGIIKYFEVEKFLDPMFDYQSALDIANPYSLDLFYTMWRRKGLFEKMDTSAPCLLNYLREQVD